MPTEQELIKMLNDRAGEISRLKTDAEVARTLLAAILLKYPGTYHFSAQELEQAKREVSYSLESDEEGGYRVKAEVYRYSILIQWSEEDQVYLVTLPEWAGRTNMPCTHGSTYSEAAEHGEEVLASLIAIAREDGEALPEPSTFKSDEDEKRWNESFANPKSGTILRQMAEEARQQDRAGETEEGGFAIE